MAISEEIIVRIRLTGPKRVGDDLDAAGRKGTRSFGALAGTLRVVSKALISMAAVIVAWTAFITIPQAIARGLMDVSKAALIAADSMSQLVLQTAGLMASFREFSADAGENFTIAVAQSEQLIPIFTRLAAESVASVNDLILAFRTLTARGGLEYVNTMEEAVELTKLLTDTILALTGGLQKERQIVSEINTFFEGIARQGALLTQMVSAQVGDLDEWLARMRDSKGLLAEMQRLFGPISTAAEELGLTFEGLKQSLIGLSTVLSRMTLGQGALTKITNKMKEWRDTLQNTINIILDARTKSGFSNLGGEARDILETFATWSTLIEHALGSVRSMVFTLTDANDEAEAFAALSNAAVVSYVILRNTIEDIVIILDSMRRAGSVIADVWNDFKNRAVETLGQLGGAVRNSIRAARDFADQGGTAADDWTIAMGEAKGATINLQNAINALITMSPETLPQAASPMRELFLRNLDEIREEIQTFMREILTGEGGNIMDMLLGAGRGRTENQEVLDRATDQLRNIRGEILMLQFGGNKLADITVKNWMELQTFRKEFKEFPEILAEIENALNFKTELELNQRRAEMLESALEGVANAAKEVNLNFLDKFLKTPDLPELDFEKVWAPGVLDNIRLAVEETDRFIRTNDDLLRQLDRMMERGEDWSGVLDQLGNSIGTIPDRILVLQQHLMQLETIFNSLKGVTGEEADRLRRQLATAMDDVTREIIALNAQLDAFEDKLTPLQKVLQNFVLGLGNAFSDFFASLTDGVDDGISAMQKLAAGMIGAAADALQAWAMVVIATGFASFNPAQIAQGFALLAASGALRGVAARLGRSPDSGSADSASGSSGRTTIFLSPTFGADQGTRMLETIDKLDNTISKLETAPAGVVVKNGAESREGRRAINGVVTRGLQANDTMRRQTLEAIT